MAPRSGDLRIGTLRYAGGADMSQVESMAQAVHKSFTSEPETKNLLVPGHCFTRRHGPPYLQLQVYSSSRCLVSGSDVDEFCTA